MLRNALSNKTYTANGALTNASTNSALVDFFGIAGAARNMEKKELKELFYAAFSENPEDATILLFYFRDILEGQGERRLFKTLLADLAQTQPEMVRKLIPFIPQYGRWDDLYCLVDTVLEADMFSFMYKQFIADLMSEKPSLLAKWMKGTRPSSAESKRLMRKTYQAFGMTMIQYQKTLAKLRKRLNIVETAMSERQWDSIDYSHVPAQAMKRYTKAFIRHNEERFSQFITKVENVEESTTIKAKTLYPHDLVKQVRENAYSGEELAERTRNAQWKALPEYALEDTIPVIDVSGSMCMGVAGVIPIDASVGIGLYAAEHLKGEFKNSFITFDSNPSFIEFTDKETFTTRVKKTLRAPWGGSTNLQGVFDLILTRAKHGNISQEDMPKRVLIISDMQFNEGTAVYEYRFGGRQQNPEYSTTHENIKQAYKDAGYDMPQLIYWNVNALTTQFPITMEDNALILSGYSPVVLKFIYGGEMSTPMDLVREVIDAPRYDDIRNTLTEVRILPLL